MKLNLVSGSGNGEPVFFQHGLCGNAAQTQEVFPKDFRFSLRTLECRGHGASEAGSPADFSIKTFAQDVAARIENPSIVGGISMGAAIALHLAVHRPELVKALVLARPAWVTEKAPANQNPNLEIGRLLFEFPPEVAREKFLNGALAHQLRENAPDNLASLTTFFSRKPIAVTAALILAIASDGPGVSENDLRNIKVPTLIIATEQDDIHPMVHAQALHGLIAHSRLVTITPKGVDKQRYVQEFQSTLLTFFEETTQ